MKRINYDVYYSTQEGYINVFKNDDGSYYLEIDNKYDMEFDNKESCMNFLKKTNAEWIGCDKFYI